MHFQSYTINIQTDFSPRDVGPADAFHIRDLRCQSTTLAAAALPSDDNPKHQ